MQTWSYENNFLTEFEIFRRRFDGVIIYFSIPNSNFSTMRRNFQSLLYILSFIFSSKFMLIFLQSLQFSIGTRAIVRSSTILLSKFCFLVKLLCIGPVLRWFRSYLVGRSQHARRSTFQTCILNSY